MKNFTYSRRKAIFLSCLLVFISSITHAQLVQKSLTASNGKFIGFYEYKPVDYNATGSYKYPVIIFLHGIGERGNGTTDLPAVLGNGTPNNIKNGHNMRFFWNGKWETFLVLIPQLSTEYGWWQNFYTDEMIKYASQNLNIDPNRIFLAGLSLGGGGTWSYAGASETNSRKLAAIAVSCGTYQTLDWCNIARANLPVWAFHATDDGTIGYTATTGAIQSINNCNPAVKPYMTIWPNGQHWIWGRVFSTGYDAQHPNIYEWFLGQDKSKPVNIRPVANGGNNISITTGLGVATLDASGSTDADGTIQRYVWEKVSGPSFGTLTSPVSTNGLCAVTNLVYPGTYVYKVTVIDDRADWTTATVTVTVTNGPPPTGNLPPVAVAGTDITITLPSNSATLNGTSSYDPGGSISSHAWSYVSGPSYSIANANTSSATLTNLVEGTYVFRLTVTDNGGLTATDDVQVIVNPAGSAPPPPPPPPPTNQAPLANAGADITITLPTDYTELDGSASYDNDGTLNAWEWTRVSGPTQFTMTNSAVAKTALTNLAQGTYVFKLRVWDNKWVPAEDLVTVKVNASTAPPPNKPPVARAGNDITITLPTNYTSLNGSASSDPDGTINSYAWTKIDGPAQYNLANGNTATASLTNLDEGTYSFRLVVTDNGGLTDDDTIQVIVNPAPAPVNQPPVARAGNDITITLPTDNTTLTGAGSTDPENAMASYAWTQVGGPAQYAIADPNAASTALSNLVQGTYTFRLLVTDNGGLWDDDTVVIRVNAAPPSNQPPVANAGLYTTITLPVNYSTLNGTASADPDGTITYAWTKIAGPGQYTITDAAAASTGVTNLAEGVYTFRLVVTDNGGLTDDDTVVIAVNAAPPPANQPAVAIARPDTTITLPDNSLTLNGSASYDPDGVIRGYEWLRIAGPAQYTLGNNNAAITTLSDLVQGTYKFRLRVWDSYWVPSDDTIVITVKPAPNVAPVANAGADVNITLPTNTVVLNGTASADANNNIASYSWTKIDGPASHSIADAGVASTTVSDLTAGTYTFRLVVTDAGGLSDADTVTVTVNPAPNVAPVAKAGTDIIVTLPVNVVTLDGSASTDADGTITTHAWTKIEGPAQYNIADPAAASTVLSNLAVGTYKFRLQVTDNSGASDADTLIVVVNPAPNTPPIANAGDDIIITLPVDNTILNGSASIDLDGLISGYAWTWVSGPSQYQIANAAAQATTLTNLRQGTYVFRLLVTDNGGLTSEDFVTVTVNATPPPPNHAPVAHAGASIDITLPTDYTDLNGSASADPDNNIVSYEWAIISGPGQYNLTNATSAIAKLNGLVQGTYTFQLVVTDAGGLHSADTMQVIVRRPPNKAPVADAGKDFTVTLPDNINLNGGASYDPDGSIAAYSWSKVSGDGAITVVNSTTSTPTIVGARPGTYIFELTVTDNEGATSTDQVAVTVLRAANVAPVASAGKDTTVAVPGSTAWLFASDSYDPDGNIIQYTWKFVNGPATTAIISSPNNVVSMVSNLTTGDYEFEVIVADNEGATSRDTVRVTIVNNFRYEEKLHVFPNPSNGSSTVNIRCLSDSLGTTRVRMYNSNGILMRTTQSFKSQSYFQMPVDISALPAGLYIIEVNIDNKKTMLTKFIKK